MLLVPGASDDLHPAMRLVRKYSDRAFVRFAGREAILTSGRDRSHGFGSFHYFGLAVDWRTNDLESAQIGDIVAYLRKKLPGFQVLFEGNHIHIEPGDVLAERLGASER